MLWSIVVLCLGLQFSKMDLCSQSSTASNSSFCCFFHNCPAFNPVIFQLTLISSPVPARKKRLYPHHIAAVTYSILQIANNFSLASHNHLYLHDCHDPCLVCGKQQKNKYLLSFSFNMSFPLAILLQMTFLWIKVHDYSIHRYVNLRGGSLQLLWSYHAALCYFWLKLSSL